MTDPLDAIDWPLRTERLTIRRSRPADAEAMWEILRPAEATEWMMFPTPSLEEFRAIFVQPEKVARRLIIERDGRVVGDLKADVMDAWAQADVAEQAAATKAELGWTVAADTRGQGIATEAVRAVIDALFAHTRVRRIVAEAFADNLASVRVMEKVGMRREALEVRDSYHRDHGWVDGVRYAILKDEWGSDFPAR